MSDSGRARKADKSIAEMALDLLDDEARQLDDWAIEARQGNWSTQHVQPMRRRADEIRRHVTYWRSR